MSDMNPMLEERSKRNWLARKAKDKWGKLRAENQIRKAIEKQAKVKENKAFNASYGKELIRQAKIRGREKAKAKVKKRGTGWSIPKKGQETVGGNILKRLNERL